MRVGVLGGTFDPIHIGHLIIAEEVWSQLGLSHVVFVPAGQPPHKRAPAITDPELRVEMVHLAIEDNAHFALSRVDVDRAEPCYSVETVRLLLEAYGRGSEIDFVIGADSLAELPTWYRPDRLLGLCRVVAVRRPGYPVDLAALDRHLPGASSNIRLLEAPLLGISSTDIRQRVREGRSIRYMVPAPVEQFIREHNLYYEQR